MVRTFAIIAALQVLATPLLAEVDLEQANACFAAAEETQSDPVHCIDAQQDVCLDNAQGTPAVALLCFRTAREAWSLGISGIISDTVDAAPEPLASVARIETKYDLLTNLLQCERVQELSIAVSELGSDAIGVQTARCQSTASALTYMRLYIRAQNLAGDEL